MAVYSGTAGTVATLTDAILDDLKEWTLDLGQAVVDVTSFGEEWNRNISGIRNFSGSFSGNDSDDGAVESFKTRLEGSGIILFHLYVSPTKYFEGTATLSGISNTVGYDGNAQLTFNFEGSQFITYV